ncbi:phospholipase D family protein [Alcanivorax sp.]|uniref:phospholipase D family protein n=1 Tax=Alcanivorax sp. TaxID=1872427 RepID=UPI000C0F88A4|nr:phospholipase D family protein [Alcanivorax sp.]PHR68566.1 MAG: phospholipase [Alcanivorax sp.]
MTRLKLALLMLVALTASTALWHRYKPLPAGLNVQGETHAVHGLKLLVDDTWESGEGESSKRLSRQHIFDEFFRLIGQAEKLIVVDMFLFNDFQGTANESDRALSSELTDALLARRASHPTMPIVVITDPINTLYGGFHSKHLTRLKKANITVVTTPLPALRDSNPSWSGLWRVCCQWLGNNPDKGWLPNPMGPGQVSLRSYLTLLNFKANHRKTLVVDEGEHWTGLVTSANAHDGSSAHSNIGLRFQGNAVKDLLASELAVAELTATRLPTLPTLPTQPTDPAADARLQLLTEGAIRDALLATLNHSQTGDQVDVSVFYLSHRPLMEALLAAQQRGVQLRVLLDPNKDAFGREKNGIPNRQVGSELHNAGIPVRWCNTQGEQCHTKMLLRRSANSAELILGSANYTRRNLDNLNLESSVRLIAAPDHAIMQQASDTFERRWENRYDEKHSTDYAVYADDSVWKYWLYRGMEFTGWSSF